MDNLKPTLNRQELEQTIDSFSKQGKDTKTIQAYVDNYKKDVSGNYVLKNAPQTGDTGLKGFATGFAKGGLEGAIGTARTLQTAGQGIMTGIQKAGHYIAPSVVPDTTFKDTQDSTGFKSLQGEDAANIDNILKANSTAEKAGKVGEFAAEVLTPAGLTNEGAALLSKGKSLLTKGAEAIAPILEKKSAQIESDTAKSIFNEALDISRPKVTKAIERQAFTEGRIGKQGLIGGAKIAPSAQEIRAAEALQPLVEDGIISAKMFNKNPAAVQTAINNEVAKINSGVKELVSNPKYNLSFNQKALDSALNTARDNNRIIFGGDATAEKAYDVVIDEFKKYVKTNNNAGLFDARQAFDKYIRNNFPKAFEDEILTGNVNPRAQALRDVRSVANNFIADNLDKARTSSVLKMLEPEEAKTLIDKAKNFEKPEDFIKQTQDQFSKKRNFTDPSEYSTTPEQDLKEIWDIAHTKVNSNVGELYIKSLRKEADLLNISKKNLETKIEGISQKGRITKKIEKAFNNPAVKTIGTIGGAGATIYAGTKAVKAAANTVSGE